MEKNYILAIVLSVAVLIGFNFLLPPVKAPAPGAPAPAAAQKQQAGNAPAVSEASKNTQGQAAAPAAKTEAPVATIEPESPERIVTVDTDLFTAAISTRGGVIKSYKLKKYKDRTGVVEDMVKNREGILPLTLAADTSQPASAANDSYVPDTESLILGSANSEGSLTLTHIAGDGVKVVKKMTFKTGSYAFGLDVQSSKPYTLYMGDGFGSLTPKEEKGYGHIGPVVFVDGQRSQDKPEKLVEPKKYAGKAGWAALCDKFFIAAIVPKGPVDATSMKGSTGLGVVAVRGADGGSYLVYAGPKEYDRLKSFKIGLEQAIDFGWFSFIAKPLFVVLKFFYGIVKNYGWAIILLTIVVKLLFAPLTHKSQKAMKKMQKLQPLFAELKEKYKGDAQRMNAEMMAIYKREKVNPMGGCLPMLIQIPVFIALYNVLNNAIELRQAPFVWWLTDLSSKDPYYVLPILMGLSMVVMQKMTPTSMDPMQNKMMMLMPVVLTFMFISLPSGLVLYFTISNLLSMAQQFYINKYSTD